MEANAKLLREKEFMCKENEYLRQLLQKEKEQHQGDVKYWKKMYESVKRDKEKLENLQQELQSPSLCDGMA